MNFELDEQQRDFAASIDAALGAADVPAAVRAWAAVTPAPAARSGRRWPTSASPRWPWPRSTTESAPTRWIWWSPPSASGHWGVPGPVTESIAVAPILLADDERSAALAAGELIATVAHRPADAACRRRRFRRAGPGRRRWSGAATASPASPRFRGPEPKAVRRQRFRRRAGRRRRSAPASSARWPPPRS